MASLLSDLLSDVRLAVRGLRHNPLFATVAILSLALGIGANAAIFRLVDQILLRTLPVRAPHELVMLYQEGEHMGNNMGSRMHSYPLYQDLQKKAAPFSDVLCRVVVPASVAVGNQTERVHAEMVSGNYFAMLGVKPALGRVLSSREDDQVYQGHPVVVLSYGYWTSRFARDPAVVGKTIRVNNYPMTIVGVSAEGFAGLDPTRSPQIRVPDPDEGRDGARVAVAAHGRPPVPLGAGVRPAQARLHRRVREGARPDPLRAGPRVRGDAAEAKDWSAYDRQRFLKGRLVVTGAAVGYSGAAERFRQGADRADEHGRRRAADCVRQRREPAHREGVRAAEGNRGAAVARVVARAPGPSVARGEPHPGGRRRAARHRLRVRLTKGLLALVPAQTQPLLVSAAPDARTLGFTFLLACATGVVFGLLPALRASRPDPWTTLKDTTGSIAGAGGSVLLRKALVVAQVALSFLLLTGAGLFVSSLRNLKATETGVAFDNLVAFEVAPALSGYDNVRATQFYRELLDRLRSAPGTASAAFASVPILAGDEWDSSMAVEGHQTKDGEDMQAFMNAVSPGYFKTMNVPLLEGRDFREGDAGKGEPVVAIVNRRFANHFFPGRSAIGKRIGFGYGPETKLTIEIVGVVGNALYEGPREGIHRQAFVPKWGKGAAVFYVRTHTASGAVHALVRDEVRRLDAGVPVFGVKTLEAQLDETLLTDRLIAMLSAAFGALATVLASVGLYGVMAFLVARRSKELGIRLTLGAAPARVTWMVMREVLLLLVVGLAVGIPATYAAGRYVTAQLYGVPPTDPAIAALTVLLLAAVSVVAGLIPARRASRIDPLAALRAE